MYEYKRRIKSGTLITQYCNCKYLFLHLDEKESITKQHVILNRKLDCPARRNEEKRSTNRFGKKVWYVEKYLQSEEDKEVNNLGRYPLPDMRDGVHNRKGLSRCQLRNGKVSQTINQPIYSKINHNQTNHPKNQP